MIGIGLRAREPYSSSPPRVDFFSRPRDTERLKASDSPSAPSANRPLRSASAHPPTHKNMSEGSSEAAQLSPKSVALKAFGALKEMGERAVVNTSQDTIFSTLEDFQRADPSLKARPHPRQPRPHRTASRPASARSRAQRLRRRQQAEAGCGCSQASSPQPKNCGAAAAEGPAHPPAAALPTLQTVNLPSCYPTAFRHSPADASPL